MAENQSNNTVRVFGHEASFSNVGLGIVAFVVLVILGTIAVNGDLRDWTVCLLAARRCEPAPSEPDEPTILDVFPDRRRRGEA